MKYLIPLTVFTLMVSATVHAHSISQENSESWLLWFGNYHFIFIHFPIALIVMAFIAELIFSWGKNPQYNAIVNFLLISAAIFAIPTILSGLSLEGSGVVTEETNPLLEWHKIFGYATLSLTIITIIARNFLKLRSLYLLCLMLLLISVIIASHLGGMMAFEGYHLLPPFFN